MKKVFPVRILSLDEIEEEHKISAGSKAYNLSVMRINRLPVPEGFCVTSGAYQAHVGAGDLLKKMTDILKHVEQSGSRLAEEEMLEELRQAIIAAPFPSHVQEEFDLFFNKTASEYKTKTVAVRSSSTAEDLPGMSFAGQYETFLGVSGKNEIIEAVKKCWASLWTERVFSYRQNNGINHSDAVMAVIIQELVPAESAGVMFMADPVKGSDRIIIESCFGLGEALVSGRLTPDRYVLSRSDLSVLEEKSSVKKFRILPDGKEEKLNAEKGGVSSIDEKTAQELAELGLKAEKLFETKLDIEWALSKGSLFLTQARPITTTVKESTLEDRLVWTNANTGEVLPDVVTPVTRSMVIPIAEKLISTFVGNIGMEMQSLPLFAFYSGRAYFCVNTLAGLIKRVPGMKKNKISDFFGGMQDGPEGKDLLNIPQKDIPDLKFSMLKFLFKAPFAFFRIFIFSPKKAARIIMSAKEETDMLEKQSDFSTMNDGKLAWFAYGIFQNILSSVKYYDTVGFAMFYCQTFFNACKRWFKEDGNAVASSLLAGLGSNENANAGIDLWALAERVRTEQKVRDALFTKKFVFARKKLEAMQEGTDFLKVWDEFMAKHGHHCRGELELGNKRWFETPDYVLDLLQSYYQSEEEKSFLARYNSVVHEREQAELQTRSRLKNPFKRMIFNKLLKKARACTPIRENIKNQMVRRMVLIRRVLLELGNRLKKSGTFEKQSDIFFFELGEIVDLANSRFEGDIRDTVINRRAEYRKNRSVTPPPVIVGRFDPDSMPGSSRKKEQKDLFTGVGVNPGVVKGKARVILKAGEDRVLPGEILVAPFTDPGWTPYFLNAAGIVMDMGGILSHGAIVAREYGIPAVVNVGPATELIKTGQMLELDGTKGTVKIIG